MARLRIIESYVIDYDAEYEEFDFMEDAKKELKKYYDDNDMSEEFPDQCIVSPENNCRHDKCIFGDTCEGNMDNW
jgi:hydrogenase maturation factor